MDEINKKAEKLNKLLELLKTDTITPEEIKQFLVMVLDFIKKSKGDFDNLSKENLKTLSDSVAYISREHQKIRTDMAAIMDEGNQRIKNKMTELQGLIDEMKAIEIKNGEDGEDADPEEVIKEVLARLPKAKPFVLKGEDIVKEINDLPDEEEFKIDYKHIKNVPAAKKGSSSTPGGGGGSRFISTLLDVVLNSVQNGDTLVWSSTRNRWENGAATAGGTWGTITGTLSAQTDLQAALDAKQSTTLADGKFLVGNGSNAATAVTPTGDVTFTNAGVFAIGAAKVTEAMQVLADNTTNDVSTTKHGYVPKGTNTTTKFLRDDGTWASVPGGGDALTSGTLAQFAATTSLQLKGVISDETGSGALVFATSPTLVTPILGTPTSGDLSNCTFPTFNQNTTGSAAKWTTARNLAGNSVDGSANVAFANKFIVQGTTDAGLSAAQFLGALGTGIVKNTTTTGVLSIAVAGDFPTLNQNTTGSAATLTTPRTIGGVSFDGSANITVASATGGFTVSGGALALGANDLTMTGSLGATGARLTKGWFTDLQVTNTITGSVSGNAGTVTTNANLTGHVTSVGNAAVLGSFTFAQLNTAVSDADVARTDAANTFTGVQTMTSPALTTPAITGLATGSGVASGATASTLAARDANANLTANNWLGGYTTTATAAGTTTLTVGSTYLQFFTGSTTQTVTLPVASTLTLGHQFVIVNNSTGLVTVNSSGGNAVIILGASTSATITCILASGTSAASWNAGYVAANVATGKVGTISNTITFAGTDGTTMTFPATNATIARTDAANTFSGTQTFNGTVALGTQSITMTGSIAATGSRVTKIWTADIESTNMPTVGGTAIISDAAYASSWNGVTGVAPSQNAVYDQLETMKSGTNSTCTANEDITIGWPLGISFLDNNKVARARRTISAAAHSLTPTAFATNKWMCPIGGDKFVILQKNGATLSAQVGSISKSTLTLTLGAAVTVTTTFDSNFEPAICKLATDKFVVIYLNTGSTTAVKYRAGTVSTVTITMGTEAGFATAGSTAQGGFSSADFISTDKGVFAMNLATATNGRMFVFTSSGTVLTVGTGAAMGTNTDDNIAAFMVKTIGTDKFVVCNQRTTSSLYAQVCTCTGTTTITAGSEVQISTTSAANGTISAGFQVVSPATDVFVVRAAGSGAAFLTACTVSGTTPTAGTTVSTSITSSAAGGLYAVSASILYVSSDNVRAINKLTLSGNTLTDAGTASDRYSSTAITGCAPMIAMDNGYFVIPNTDATNVEVYIQGMANNFVGMAQSTISSGQSIEVRVGGVDGNQSGLVAGTYYLVNNGTLSALTNIVLVNTIDDMDRVKAISATQVII